MNRAQLEHILRAAAIVSDDLEIVVIGSQAILGAHPDAPPEMLKSIEADVYPRRHPERADVIDGALGEGSYFHSTFGYYAQGVGPETATLAPGWEDRLVAISSPATSGATGLCLEPHDLVLSKLVAGRPKDLSFGRAAARHRLVEEPVLRERLARLAIDPRLEHAVSVRIRRVFDERDDPT